MDWITGIQNAIDYIEEHLTESIDYDKVSEQSFSSSYHFQRIFSILCGFTIGEYVRNRRLSLSGSELVDPFLSTSPINMAGCPSRKSSHS